jgi:hypothetical protein
MKFLKALCAGLLLTAGIAGSAAAQDFTDNDMMGSGKLLATGGVTELEGAGGGGITPWALITGYETNRQVGVTAFGTYANTGHLTVSDGGVAIGLFNRVEFSYARLNLGLGDSINAGALAALNKGSNNLTENIEGVKVRLFGDAVYDEYIPEVSAGVLLQQSQNKVLVNAIGAKSTGETYYLAFTKLYFDVIFGRDVLLDADIIGTKANQLGLLGFGSNRDEAYHPEFAGSAAVLLTRGLAVGVDFRTMPRNLKAVGRQGNWSDIFIAYLPNKHFSITAAYAMLGDVATGVDSYPGSTKNQNAFYISGQVAF